MRATIMHAPGDVRVVDETPRPTLQHPTDAIIKVGREYDGTVAEVGAEVSSLNVGDFVVGSFFASDNTGEICRSGDQTGCVSRHEDRQRLAREFGATDIVTERGDEGVARDLEPPQDQAAEGRAAMDERRAVKVLLRP